MYVCSYSWKVKICGTMFCWKGRSIPLTIAWIQIKLELSERVLAHPRKCFAVHQAWHVCIANDFKQFAQF
jgi:hypothetical protein